MIGGGHLKLTGRRSKVGRGAAISYRRSEIEKELLRRRGGLYALKIDAKHKQLFSENLFLEFQTAGNRTAASDLLIQPLPASSIMAFLGGSAKTPSAFERFGFDIATLDGEVSARYRMRSHMFRHWLNTVANKAGMTAFQITLWMQRRSVEETRRYLHESSEIAELDREWIRQRTSGRRAGRTLQSAFGY